MGQIWSNLPNWAKFVSVAMLSVLLTVGIANPEVFDLLIPGSEQVTPGSEQVTEEPKTIEVEFNIRSEDTNDPVERAEVQFIFDGAPAPRFTNSDGYVRIEIPDRADVDVVIKKEGFYDLNRTINLKADANRTVTYFLERDENYSSYNLFKGSFNNGMVIKQTESQKAKYSFSIGSLNDSSVDKPFFRFTVDSLLNKESDYEVVDSDGEDLLELVEKVRISTDSVSAKMDVLMRQENKTYEYSSNLSEDGTFAGSSILHKYSDGKWSRSITEGQPTAAQVSELAEPWSLNDLFLEYPSNPLKLGQTWSVSHLFWSSGGDIIDPSIQATLENIAEHEGQRAALVSLEGTVSFSDIDQSDGNSDDASLVYRVYKSLERQFYSDYAEEYLLSDIKETVTNDLYYDEFSLNDDSMRERNPRLYNALIRIYQEITADPELSNYSLSTIREVVNGKLDEHSILALLIERLENSSASNPGNSNNTLSIDATVSGKTYRSLEKPVDLYQEIKLVGESAQDSTDLKLEAEIISRFSV